MDRNQIKSEIRIPEIRKKPEIRNPKGNFNHRWTQKFNHNAEIAEGEPPMLFFFVLFVFFVVKSFLVCVHLCPSVVKLAPAGK